MEPPAPKVFVSLSGNDATCARGASTRPCASFDRAYKLAQKGDTVEVAGGNYPEQVIHYDDSKPRTGAGCRIGAYVGKGFVGADTSGCVTFAPAAGAAVSIGAHTTTTSNIDMTVQTTIPVVSTDGFYLAPGQPYYYVGVGSAFFDCTGKDQTTFTGCSASVQCQPSGGWLCGWDAGTDVFTGFVEAFGASYVRFEDIRVAGYAAATADSTGHSVSDVIFDRVTAAFGYSHGNFIGWTNSRLGNNNGSNPTKFTNCDYCGIYRTSVTNATLDHCDGGLSAQNTNYFCHGDGLYLNGNTNFFIVRSSFVGNEAFHVFFDHGGSWSSPGPVTIANSYFGRCGAVNGCSAAVSIRGDTNDTLSGYTITGNTSLVGWLVGVNGGMSNVVFSNWTVSRNNGVAIPCGIPAGATRFDVTYTHNLVASAPCISKASPLARDNTTYASDSSSAKNSAARSR